MGSATRRQSSSAPSPLLNAKLYVPRPRPASVPRPRLVERLNDQLWQVGGFTRTLTLLSAPAGFGKTTLLAEWAAGCRWPIAWLSLDVADNAPPRFLSYLIAALQRVREAVGTGLLDALHSPQPPPTEAILSALIHELETPLDHAPASPERGLILVLDDYQAIEAQPIHDILDLLLQHLPADVHVTISTRVDPPLPLARLRARGQLLELRQDDLRFTRREVDAFLRRTARLVLSPGDVDALASRTEGWIAGLQMAALSMQRRDDLADFVRAFTGSHRYIIDYLVEEVFSQQPAAVQAFLLRTAILDRMTAALCDAVTERQDSQALLEQLEQENMFVVALDDERRWYRYHRLFRDVLRQRLLRSSPQLTPTLHNRASAWYEERDLVAPAVDHALSAGNLARATDLIAQHADTLWARGEQARLLEWLDALPVGRVRAQPRLDIIYALVLFAAGRNDEAASHLAAAQQSLDAAPTSRDRTSLQGVLDAACAFVAFSRGDLAPIIQRSRRALDALPAEELLWRSIATYTLGLAQRLSGDLASAGRTLEQAVQLSSATGNNYVVLIARLNLARLAAQRGHLRRAAEMLRQALRIADETGMGQLPAAGLLSAELSSILIEWNVVDEAVDRLETGLERIQDGKDVTAIQMAYAFMTRALLALGDLEGAQATIHQMEHLAAGADVSPWIHYWIVALKLQTSLAQGDLTSAARLAEQAGLDVEEEPTYAREMAYAPLVQLYIAQGRAGAAMKLLERLLHTAQEAERLGRVIATLALRACALAAQGDMERALTDLERALSLAQPEGYVRVFVEQGPAMANLLRRAATRGIAPRYASRLLAAFDVSAGEEQLPEQPLIEPLTERELDVLRLLESDLTMAEIAHQLFVAHSTVRSHAKHIYGKLNVHSRREAVRRAHALGILT